MSKLSYTSGVSDQPLLGVTIGDLFNQVCEAYGLEEALVVKHQNIRWTYNQLKREVDQCARALIGAGIRSGDRVGIWSPNCAEWTVLQFATAKVGAILVNINPNYRLHELEYTLNQSGCSLLFFAHRSKYMDYTEIVYQLLPELSISRKGQLHADRAPDLRYLIRLFEGPSRGVLSWNEFLTYSERVRPDLLQRRLDTLDFDDPINIQYTSGTTGFPKAATLTHHNLINNGYFAAFNMGFSFADRLVIPVPLYHCFGMVLGNLGCLAHGATMIYPGPGFDAEAVLKTVEEEKATALFGVPTMFIAEIEELKKRRYDLRSLRTGIMAGAPCPVEVMKKVKKDLHIPEIQIAYGMTETSPVVTQTRTGTPTEKQVTTVGTASPHTEIKIIHPENGHIVGIGERGEICARGYCVMLKYWNQPEKTRETIEPTGWIHTGDLGIMDTDGYISIVGRIKDMIIRGGENIYPREIEEFLHTHPMISDVQVIGVPDEVYGEEVMAWIKLKNGLTEDEIRKFCKNKIAYYKIPRYIKFTDSFPMTVTGKVRKNEMRRISIKELGLSELNRIEEQLTGQVP